MDSLPCRVASLRLRVYLLEKKDLDHGFWEDESAGGSLTHLPWVGKIPGGGHGTPLQFSCLENP